MEIRGWGQKPSPVSWCSHNLGGSVLKCLPSRVTETHHTMALLSPLPLPTRLRSSSGQVAVRPRLSLRALLPSLCRGNKPALSSFRHMWEANEKMKVCAGQEFSVPIPAWPHTLRVRASYPWLCGLQGHAQGRGKSWGQLPIS